MCNNSLDNNTLLGIDYGRKRLGLAISHSSISSPLRTVPYNSLDEVFPILEELIEEHEVCTIVLGYPKNMNNSVGKVAEEAKKFAEQIFKRFGIKTILWDERLTSRYADRLMISSGLSRSKRKKFRDQIAASLILQSYIDSQTKHS